MNDTLAHELVNVGTEVAGAAIGNATGVPSSAISALLGAVITLIGAIITRHKEKKKLRKNGQLNDGK